MGQLAVVTTEDISQGSDLNEGWKRFLSTYVARNPDDLAVSGICFAPDERNRFKGCIEYGDLGASNICRVVSSSHRYIRQPQKSFGTNAPAMLVLQTRGTSSFQQGRRRICLSPGDWNVYDTSQPFSISSNGDSEHLVFLQEHASMMDTLRQLEQMPTRSFGCNGIERAARDLILISFRECGRMSGRAGEVAASSITQMVCASVEEAAQTHTAPVQSLRAQIIDFIDAHITNEDLTVGTIALAFGNSTRQIHRIFHDEAGMTVSEYIWKTRLAHVLQDLRSAVTRDKTITEIAFTWGFSNSAHFSRAFKEAYGVTPSHCRNAAA